MKRNVFLLLSLFCASCVSVFTQTFKADTALILQESEYPKFYSKFTKKYRSPYLAVYKKGNKTLVYLAAKHSPETIPSVQYAFDVFNPQIALVEREPNEPFIPCNEGEDGYTAALSAKRQIPLVRADASLERQWNAAKQAGFSYEDWQTVWLIRTAYYGGLEGHITNARAAIKDYERRHHNPSWGPLFTEDGLLGYFTKNYQKDFNNMDFVQFFYDLTDVYERNPNTPFNRLLVNMDTTRNSYMLQNIVQALNQYDTVFVESGSAHYHYLTKALKKMLGKPHYITADQIPPQELWQDCTLDGLQEKVLVP